MQVFSLFFQDDAGQRGGFGPVGKITQKVTFVADYNVTGEAATKAVSEMKEGDVVLLQNTRFRGKEETNPLFIQALGDVFRRRAD